MKVHVHIGPVSCCLDGHSRHAVTLEFQRQITELVFNEYKCRYNTHFLSLIILCVLHAG